MRPMTPRSQHGAPEIRHPTLLFFKGKTPRKFVIHQVRCWQLIALKPFISPACRGTLGAPAPSTPGCHGGLQIPDVSRAPAPFLSHTMIAAFISIGALSMSPTAANAGNRRQLSYTSILTYQTGSKVTDHASAHAKRRAVLHALLMPARDVAHACLSTRAQTSILIRRPLRQRLVLTTGPRPRPSLCWPLP